MRGPADQGKKFCSVAMPDKQKQCMSIMKDVLSDKEQKEIDGALLKLVEVSGRDPDEIADLLIKHCPLCPSEDSQK